MGGKRILVTGGAGFVGSHTADALIKRGHKVHVYDNCEEQVHAEGIPEHLADECEFSRADVRDLPRLSAAVSDAEVIFHFAAKVGVGQSMYEIAEYTAVNNLGTANLLQAILDTHAKPEKIIVASSMSIYGEGKYLCADCGEVAPPLRGPGQLKRKEWEVLCPICRGPLAPVATNESKPLQCSSVYALSKKDQEEIALLFGRTYGIPVVALRYFNIYGSRQSLSNPYTGVAAIFASRLMNGSSPTIFEDGTQMRDFVSVRDIVQANLLAMEVSTANGMVLNVGSGEAVTIRQVAAALAQALGISDSAAITEKYRSGDIRHCFADISGAKQVLGYQPSVSFQHGIEDLVEWLRSREASDRSRQAMLELDAFGLVA